jgi:DNA-binding MarR family transcriptional regulator
MNLQDYLSCRRNLPAALTAQHTRLIDRRRPGLTRMRWRMLVNLAEGGRLTATELSTRVPGHKTKIARALVALEGRGWVRRETDAADHRRASAGLTLV